MMRATSPLPDAETAPVDADLVATIQAIEADDLVVLNDDTRTWEVSDVVERDLADEADARVAKRALRLVAGTGASKTDATMALVLVEYPDRHEAGIHVLDSPHWYEVDQVYPVESVEVLETVVPWVVVRRQGTPTTYHLPAPAAAARGQARPVCGGPAIDAAETDYRIVSIRTVYPAKRVCKDCARHHQPRSLGEFACPACGRTIGDGVVHGRGAGAVAGVAITCPSTRCEFEGVIECADS